jgi:hypothetical protein
MMLDKCVISSIVLFNKGIKMNVKVFRLNSGEEILARFEMTDTHVTLKDAAILVPVGQGQIGLMPWMMYTKAAKGVEIPLSFIAFSVEPLDELKSQYDASLNKGIVAPTSGLNNKGPQLKLVQ